MERLIEGEERSQITLLPACLDDYIADENPERVVDVVVDELKPASTAWSLRQPAGRRTTRRYC